MYKYYLTYTYMKDPVCYKNTMLTQLGRLYCLPTTEIEKHAHLDWFELTIATSGEGTVITNGVSTNISEGDIYLSYPGDFHEIIPSKTNPLQYDFFAFNTKNAMLKKELKRIMNTYSYNQRVFKDTLINSAVSNAIAEMSSKNKYHHDILSLMFEQIIFHLVRNFDADSSSSSNHRISTDELCFQIMHYIDTHIYSINNLSDLSDKFSYNYSYLSDLFKNHTGNTITNYYQTRRLEAAKLLIKEGNLKIINIAEMLNYSSLYAFSKAFKKKYGVSPKQYTKSDF